MLRQVRTVGIVAVGLLWVAAAPAQEDVDAGRQLIEVTVTGSGMDAEEAKRDGMRKAVEQVAGQVIYSQSKTRDFVLLKDTVLTRAAGFVHSHEVLETTKESDGIVHVKLRCVVSRKGIVDTWGVVKNFLKQLGRPKIVVLISERVDEVTDAAKWRAGAAQRSFKQVEQAESTVQTRIENLLLKQGFDVVSKAQLETLDAKDLQAAKAANDPAKVQAVAKRFGAQLFIKGVTHAATGLPKTIGGVYFHTYEASANVKCFRTDTAQLLSSQSTPAPPPRGVKRVWRSAANQALTTLGDKMAPEVVGDILGFWLEVTTGGGEVKLEVGDISFRQSVRLKKALAGIKNVEDVNHKFTDRIASYRIQTPTPAAKLAEQLLEIEIGDKVLDVSDITQNVIKAKLTAEQ